MTMNIFFYEAFEEEHNALVANGASSLDSGFTWKTIQEYGSAEPPAPIISIRTQSVIPPEWAPKLKAILTRSTGYDHLTRYCRATGANAPACGYLPLYCNRSVAEQALTLWMALLRRLPEQMAHFSSFARDGLTGREAAAKRLLVIGVGKIGSEIVSIGRGLRMEVRGIDLVKRLPDLEYVSFEEGAPWADIVAVAMNLTDANAGYFSAEKLAMLKPGALLINIARGEFTPLKPLAEAIESGHLGGAGLDVFEQETKVGPNLRSNAELDKSSPLYRLSQAKNVILTPHNAFNTAEAVQRKSQQSVEQLKHFLENGTFIWPI
ncbi:MAG: hypothetical protein IJT83_11455 [Victivallales bacterium]|nr:hypothetical protein [Victivallales bacterium]